MFLSNFDLKVNDSCGLALITQEILFQALTFFTSLQFNNCIFFNDQLSCITFLTIEQSLRDPYHDRNMGKGKKKEHKIDTKGLKLR